MKILSIREFAWGGTLGMVLGTPVKGSRLSGDGAGVEIMNV